MKLRHMFCTTRHLLLLTFLTGILVLAGCASDDTPEPKEPEFYIKFKAGGTEIKYDMLPNSLASFAYLDSFGFYLCTITGMKQGSDGKRDFISMQLRNETQYTPNTVYRLQDPIQIQSSNQARIIFTYFDGNGKGYNATLLQSNYPSLSIHENVEIKFTEMSSDYVKGTFSAEAYEVDFTVLGNRKEILITDGEFLLPRFDDVSYTR